MISIPEIVIDLEKKASISGFQGDSKMKDLGKDISKREAIDEVSR